MKSARSFFNNEQQDAIRKAILEAEQATSGEIRVHIENTCKRDVLERAVFVFNRLDMNKTELRNGVLIYLAVKDRKFAIIGDSGIHAVVPENYWDDIKSKMLISFQQDDFTGGLKLAILDVGQKLKTHFPHQSGDVNELPDDISFGKN
ncbi:MAG: TPM domain-containing protein [Bacteroidetes bacterium]|nr:TPM domain-containing protein [Bacteroidota bacterium]